MGRSLFFVLLWLPASLWAQPFAGLSDAIDQGGYGSLKAVVVSRHGEIIFEAYFQGTNPGDLHPVYSVTKSVGSALVGIANRQGKIRLEQGLDDFFSALYPIGSGVFTGKQNITVEAVLQQRLGIQWDEWTLDYRDPQNPFTLAVNSGDWYRYVLSRPMDAPVGEKFAYNSFGSTLMSRMIRTVSGQGPRSFAMQELFGPLGISTINWEGYSDRGMGFGMTDWPNPDGDEPLGFALWLKPTDMVKFGELYLNGGVHKGSRILDESWIDASWARYSNSDNTEIFAANPDSGYGYQWWATSIVDDRDRSWKINYAAGWARQYIMVIPDLDMVVVSVADDYDYDGPGIGALLSTFIFPELSPVLDRRFNGAWYNPDTVGQGLTLEILDDGKRLIGFWYTFGDTGSKRWFTFDGSIEGSVGDVSIIQTTGGVFLQSDPVSNSEWGTGRFSVIDCRNLTFEIDSMETKTTVPLRRLTGSC